jgi:hypothetical protein
MIWKKESVDEKQDFPRSAVIFSKSVAENFLVFLGTSPSGNEI